MVMDLGSCPTGQHATGSFRCGFMGCVDLRGWAKENRYRYRLEESYKAESNGHVRGDGRWFVEILCRHGLIYPAGGPDLLAYASRGVVSKILDLGPDIRHHQYDGGARVFRFPVSRLDEVAAILKPRRRRPPVAMTPERLAALREGRKRIAGVGQTACGGSLSAGGKETAVLPLTTAKV
ncbi:MAG: hypothetical protein HYV01_19290 [Deltaproteobacteria bacterium]|nr:hypothetical protein [Deltaproteobacteria bacterium]